MNQRIQKALDRELHPVELTRGEAIEWSETEALLDGVVRAIPEEPLPDLSASVLSRIRATHSAAPAPLARPARFGTRIATAARWMWTPRPLQWRPAYALAAAAMLAIVTVPVLGRGSSAAGPQVAVAPQVFVQFRLDAPNATQVRLAGDFTEWQPLYVLTRSAPGTWTVVVPVAPGVHQYAFVVDGERWVADPLAPPVDDGFGGINSRLAVLTPDSPKPL